MAILRVSGLSKYFGQRMLFTGVSFEIAPGDRVGLVGVNGCGKTTLFNILRGTEPHEEGQVSFAKECMTASMEQTVEIPAETTVYDAVLAVFSPLMQLERDLQQIADQLEKGEGDVQRLINRQARLMERYEQDGGLTYRSRTRSALIGWVRDQEGVARWSLRPAARACSVSASPSEASRLAAAAGS